MTLERPSTIDLLAAELRREILDGRLEAGSRLRERELCESYGVARHTLRGALRVLAADGLVQPVHAALRALGQACEGGEWSEVNEAHAALHGAIVAAARSPRIAAAHEALNGEMRLFLLQLQPHLPLAELAASHRALVAGLETDGPAVLREHLRDAAETLVSCEEDRAGRTAVLPSARLEEGDATRPGGGRTL
jgi:DNA-binding GntR family transcriptional regulator